MLLVIGGSFQGKLKYVKEIFQKKEKMVCVQEVLEGSALIRLWEMGYTGLTENGTDIKILNGLQTLLYEKIGKAENADGVLVEAVLERCRMWLEQLIIQNPDIVIICDEVGYGVVPIDKKERLYREAVGRLLCFLAQKAESMERIIGGVPLKIK